MFSKETWLQTEDDNGEITGIAFLFFLQACSSNSLFFHEEDHLVLSTHTIHSLTQVLLSVTYKAFSFFA